MQQSESLKSYGYVPKDNYNCRETSATSAQARRGSNPEEEKISRQASSGIDETHAIGGSPYSGILVFWAYESSVDLPINNYDVNRSSIGQTSVLLDIYLSFLFICFCY
mmetsp:Transcript_9846/g.20496  ORF Transcript_9846/g.20496 Transcript_9846/m.20496 type:complete len:108 (+) Transcript_9846:777-1100(+)